MKTKIRIYKSPEEKEKFYKEFYQRICFQELLWKSFMYQQMHLNYQTRYGEKIALPKPDFSAS